MPFLKETAPPLLLSPQSASTQSPARGTQQVLPFPLPATPSSALSAPTKTAANIGPPASSHKLRFDPVKAAGDSRTPRPCGSSSVRRNALAFWSAAVPCRFSAWRELVQLGTPTPSWSRAVNARRDGPSADHSCGGLGDPARPQVERIAGPAIRHQACTCESVFSHASASLSRNSRRSWSSV
jgi:hypothetical protein